MRVKICGLTSTEEAAYVRDAGADYAGVVLFFPKSKRNMELEEARRIVELLKQPPSQGTGGEPIRSVAVTVAPELAQARAAQEAGFDYLQIHGEIAPGILEELEIPILKAYNLRDLGQWERWHAHPRIAGYVLDAAEPGSGKVYDWSVLERLPRDEKLFLLAGGLTPENVAEAIRIVAPDGVDVSSGVEYSDRRGKDPARVAAFLRAAKGCSVRGAAGIV